MAKDAKLIPVKLLYDFWDDKGTRYTAPQIIELPLEAAKAMLATGKAERADPLPGDD